MGKGEKKMLPSLGEKGDVLLACMGEIIHTYVYKQYLVSIASRCVRGHSWKQHYSAMLWAGDKEADTDHSEKNEMGPFFSW